MAARRGIPVALHTPSEVKAAVTGSGRADKAQVTAMVTRILKLTERPSPADAADALALAMCHIWRGSATQRLDEALAKGAQGRSGVMIAFVKGPVSAVFGDSAVVDVGGVGILVMCTPAALSSLRVGEEATLATSMVVREDSLTLFGFADYDERGIFELLQTASGVGPKLAQAMVAVHGPDELRRAVVHEDLVSLCKVPGIGKKGAQRIVLELKDKIGAPTGSGAGPVPVSQRRRGLLARPGSCGTARARLVDQGSRRLPSSQLRPRPRPPLPTGTPSPVGELLRSALRSLSKA